MKDRIKLFLLAALVIVGGYYAYRLDFWVWQQSHPGAPTWTYWAQGR